MHARDFCFWLQGFFEVEAAGRPERSSYSIELNDHQVVVIQKHLALVFKHEIDPAMGPPLHQAALNALHTPQPPPANPFGKPDPTTGALMRC